MSNGGSSSTLQNSMGAMSNAGSGGFSPQTPPYGQGNQQGGFMQGGFGQQGGFQPQGGFGQQGSSPFGGGRPPWMQQQQQTPPWMQQQQQTPPWMQQQQPSWMQQQPPPWMQQANQQNYQLAQQQPQAQPIPSGGFSGMPPQYQDFLNQRQTIPGAQANPQQAYGGNSQREMFEQMNRVQSQRAQLQQDMGSQLQNQAANPAGGQGMGSTTLASGPMTMAYRPQARDTTQAAMNRADVGMGGYTSGMGMRPQPYGYYKKGGKV